MQDHKAKKDEKIPISISIRNGDLGDIAYAPIPELAEKDKKAIEEKEKCFY